MPILDVFVERFIDAFAPDERDDCGTSSAIREAGSVMMFSPLLTMAFRAVSIAYFGQSTDSPRIMSQGYKIYCQTLNHLQRSLWDPRESRTEGVFATVILLMAYESLQHTSERALISHCMSALKLIEFRNPWNHMFGIEHLCFTELLPYWVATALVMRKPTFLARKEWKTVPWSAKGRTKDIMELLLEQVVDLPAVLWRHDRYIIALQTPSTLPSERYLLLSRIWSAVSRVEASLRRWKRDWADAYIFGRPSEVEYQGAGGFPVFQYLDPITQRIITPRTIIYPDPQLARTLCMYYAAMLMLSSVDTRPVGAITAAERLEFAHLICRSMEYYIRTVPGNMINRMAFPLRVAYDSLPERSLERRYIEEVFRLVARRNALRAWGKYIPDISPKV
ncbi:hypothetical protein OIDMADRAFT_168934 [Oidiodendron maius Zn]|uniref:C6 finger domain protein n=1 Tax=Oidiodendron maius (strain Zn) TaxID=913774 RepID=A0A0C3D5M1_OIDMZ|nr:hypothetical protein OIDMADRAFT_168934 [Oidiodendron maius Zn]